MKIQLRHNDDRHFSAVTATGQSIELDGAGNHGARPMETVLAGLGGCSAVDVLSVLKKSRQAVTDCTIDIDATRAATIPAVFEAIHLRYTLSGHNLDPKKVARAVALSVEKYCSVSRMLEKTATITHSIELREP